MYLFGACVNLSFEKHHEWRLNNLRYGKILNIQIHSQCLVPTACRSLWQHRVPSTNTLFMHEQWTLHRWSGKTFFPLLTNSAEKPYYYYIHPSQLLRMCRLFLFVLAHHFFCMFIKMVILWCSGEKKMILFPRWNNKNNSKFRQVGNLKSTTAASTAGKNVNYEKDDLIILNNSVLKHKQSTVNCIGNEYVWLMTIATCQQSKHSLSVASKLCYSMDFFLSLFKNIFTDIIILCCSTSSSQW